MQNPALKSMNKKVIKYSFFILILVLGAASWIAYREYNRKRSDTADLKPAFELKAPELIHAFETNEATANKTYLDKVLAVDGTVKSVDKDDNGFYTVVLGMPEGLSAVRCSMDSLHNAEAANLKPGATARVKGICTGFNADEMLGSDVVLNRCTLKN